MRVIFFFGTQGGYRDVMKLADNFAAFNQRLKYAHYRPSVPVKIDAKSWWKYAYRVVSEQIKIARYLNVNLCFLIDAGFLRNLHWLWKALPCGSLHQVLSTFSETATFMTAGECHGSTF